MGISSRAGRGDLRKKISFLEVGGVLIFSVTSQLHFMYSIMRATSFSVFNCKVFLPSLNKVIYLFIYLMERKYIRGHTGCVFLKKLPLYDTCFN